MVYSVELIELAEMHQRHHINRSNVDGSYNCELEVLDEKKICASLPRMNYANLLKQLKDLEKRLAETILADLPWLYGHPPLPDNKEMTPKRLRNTIRSLKSANRLNEYHREVFNQWEREDISKIFDKWKDELTELKKFSRLSYLDLNERIQLDIPSFLRCVKSAYATRIFLRTEKDGKVTCQLIQARSRVALLKRTIRTKDGITHI
ncbi:uncharacterized protein NPIL_397491 [Nephila pilipes]|uniref:Uncharacterized protein n=1 Tax=Nephila pilipes TaxID=299642 RepID=A0A8X6NIA7_NEPPI|nr:uncharacterized protein NPIL_397491 [Nephila pilipes]